VFMVFVLLGLITVSCFASHGDAESWGFVIGFRGRVFGSFVSDGFLYFCGYVHRFIAGKYFPMVFVAKYDIGKGRLVWFRVVEDVRGWAYSVLVKDSYVYVSGLLADVGRGFIICLSSNDGKFLWGYVAEKCFKGLLDLGDYVLAYGEGQFTILNREGYVVKNVIVELRDSVGEWFPINVMKAIYVGGKIYAVGYQWYLVSERRVFDGFLICFSKDLEVEWAEGFGTEEFNEYFTDICFHNKHLYMSGFSTKMGKESTEVEGVIAAKFSLNGTPLWIKVFEDKRCVSAQSIHVFNGDIYIVGTYKGNMSSLHDILVLKISGESEASAWTIGGSLEEFCWKSIPYREGIVVYGRSATWSFNETEPYPIIVYWPLDSVGEVKWNIEGWEPIKVEKKPAPIPSTPYEMVFQNLELRKRKTYCKKYVFKIAGKEITLNFAHGLLSSERKTAEAAKNTPISPTKTPIPRTPKIPPITM